MKIGETIAIITLSTVIAFGFCTCGHAQPSAPCDPQTMFKNLTALNFITKLSACGVSDIQAVIDDANANADYVALACHKPLLGIVQNLQGASGLFMKFQQFRNARKSGVLGACAQWINSTLAPITF